MELLQYMAWPIAALVLVLVFLVMFRKQIAQLVGKVSNVGKEGVKFTSEQSLPGSGSNAIKLLNAFGPASAR